MDSCMSELMTITVKLRTMTPAHTTDHAVATPWLSCGF
eukprot:CAMPEP_0114120226 /NCGR_PEP_ID=MMETSP0043_2-20121206/6533_1 /TAXON_ID=464988 /ORGANISM="Hemiselmis andersenii, Strain CCMP644" /LENGTH=37 /DNA_ID= /DNA_START= /DNA_END= /DNA_ORIENTATION=